MFKNLQAAIKGQWIFFTGYLIFLIACIVFLNSYEKLEGQRLINQNWTEWGDASFPYITFIGDGITAIAVIVTLLFLKLRYGMMAIIAFGLTAGITQTLKRGVYDDVKRPKLALWPYYEEGGEAHKIEGVELRLGNSFPSGHTTSAFAIFCLISLLSNRKWVGGIGIILAVLAGFSRSYLSQHFIEDVYIGSMIGTIGSLLIYVLFKDKLKHGIWNKGVL